MIAASPLAASREIRNVRILQAETGTIPGIHAVRGETAMVLTIIQGANRTTAEVQQGEKLIMALERAGASVNAPCGGRCFCGKCLVKVEGAVSALLDAERNFITEEMIAQGWRLACACTVEGDVAVYIEEARATVMVEGVDGDVQLRPIARAVEADCKAPSLKDQTSDAARLCEALGLEEDAISDNAMEQLPEAIRAGKSAWAAMFDGKVTAVYPEKPGMYGCAVDVGTTTMAAYLIDLATGVQLAAASALNHPRTHGGDAITRSNYTT